MNERDELRTADLANQRPADEELAREERPPDAVGPDDRAPGLAAEAGTDEERAWTERPEAAAPASPGPGAVGATSAGPLLATDDAEAFRARWTDVQNGFVDAPRRAVEQADGLVAEVMQNLAKTFADERSELERQWDRGDDVSTDNLRVAFQRYRSFFERLLAT
jgi:hypothetical protein